MTVDDQTKRTKPAWRKWVTRGFIAWAILSTAWLFDTFRTRGVDPRLLESGPSVTVREDSTALTMLAEPGNRAGLIFICGAGVAARAYVPLLRPIADAGYSVFIIKLPYRLAPLESHKQLAIARVQQMMAEHVRIPSWVLAGHSLGGALACRVARDRPTTMSALVLIGTTHPKRDNLASLSIPVVKVYGSRDGVAPSKKVDTNRHLLPAHTNWIRIEGANHSQFGHYGHQLFDGTASISRTDQQRRTRAALVETLDAATR